MSKIDMGKSFVEHLDFGAQQREALAKKGQALPDGSYPIRNRADLQRAIQAFGRSKNKARTKRWIIRRARELNATDLLPEGWDVPEETKQSSWLGSFIEHHGVKGMKWGVRRSKRQLARAAASKGKSVKDMSDEELRAAVNRMNMEQQYTRLTGGGGRNRGLIAAGATFAGSILVGVARQQLTNAANAQVGRALGTRRK